ncbi:MAG: hypothetical protein P0Y49_02280 [Candidatus Pedobacter colombiensis]|uniref:Lipocalin-like domain-containing protein n=1 Tax=Candidatus Pedobacter colombiensis TaxID=3121371 RepID=A0AAJ6B784_9SPHI|nr:hypothetical protein [Pedobacter sp.]WEK19980.1 MAG: hypothetical protein P0Y49_02280 [Pedobacter sp.]
MIRLLLVAFMATVVVGCKRDGSKVEKISDNLIGKWSVQSNSIIYFDQSGQKEYEEILNTTSLATNVSFVKGSKAKIETQDSAVVDTPYDLAEEDSLIYMKLNDAEIFNANVWKLTDVTGSEMTWKANFTNIKYEDKDTGEILEAPKAELTLKFNKQ